MRQTPCLKVLRSQAHFTTVPYRRFLPQQWIGISRSNAPSSPIAIPPKTHIRPAGLREGRLKRFSTLACQTEGVQSLADIQAFTDWLLENGGQGIDGDTQKVDIYQYGKDGRGLRATMDVQKGDLILSMPMDLVLAHKSDEEEFNAKLGDNLDEFTALAVKLLKERAQLQQNRYYPYIQVLPVSVPSLYGGFPESLREELQGFVSDPDWEEGRNRTAFEYAKVSQSPLMRRLTEDDFRWAYSVVSSRAFAAVQQAPDGSKVKMKFFAPLLDMMDHGGLCKVPGEEPVRLDNVRWGMQDVGSGAWRVQVFATQAIAMGQPLLLRYIDGFPSTHYLLHYGFVPTLDPNVETDLFPHMYGAVNWTLDKLFSAEKDGIGESELQRLAAEAHRAAREVGLKDIMAANESGGVTRDSLRKAHPLAVKLRAEGGYLDSRFLAAVDVLKQHRQGSPKEKKVLVYHLLLSRIEEMLTQPGRTSLDADLQILARHAAPADRSTYGKCLERYRAMVSFVRSLHVAGRSVQDYERPASDIEGRDGLDTCTLQAVQLRAAQKMLLLDALAFAAKRITESREALPKRRPKINAGSRSSAPRGFGSGAPKSKRKP